MAQIFTKENVDFKRIYDIRKEDIDANNIKLNGIRLTNQAHINEIASSMLTKKPFIACVEININTMEVVDGQHRFEAKEKAWEEGNTDPLEVRFLDIPRERQDEIVKEKNIHSKNWTIKDYKRAAVLNGNPAMKIINDFCMSHDLLHGKIKKDGTAPVKDRYAMAFLKGSNVTKDIKEGTLKIEKQDVEFAEKIYPEVKRLLKELCFNRTAAWFESFVQAWWSIRRDYYKVTRFENINMEDYYSLIHTMDRATTTSKSEWEERFIGILMEVEKKTLNKEFTVQR